MTFYDPSNWFKVWFGQRVCASTFPLLFLRFPFYFILFYFIFFQPQSLTKSSVNSIFMHCSQIPQIIAIFLLKIDPTALFIYLKIISLQCFIFQFSVSVQISCIQMDQSKLHFYTQGFLLSSAQKA